jgi:hypothetical protein
MFDFLHEQPTDWTLELTSGPYEGAFTVGPWHALGNLHRAMGLATFAGSVGSVDGGFSAPAANGDTTESLSLAGDPETGTLTFSELQTDYGANPNTTTIGTGHLIATDGSYTEFTGHSSTGEAYTVSLSAPTYDHFRMDNALLPVFSGFIVALFIDITAAFILRRSIGTLARDLRGLDQIRGVN